MNTLPASHPFARCAPAPRAGSVHTTYAGSSSVAQWARDVAHNTHPHASSAAAARPIAGPSRQRTSTASAASSTTTSTTTTCPSLPHPRPSHSRTSIAASISVSTTTSAQSDYEAFLSSLPPALVVGSVSRRGGMTLEERHLSIEVAGAVVGEAQVQRAQRAQRISM